MPRRPWLAASLLRPGGFARAATTLQIGSLATAAVGFLSSVALARTLEPDGYGTLALVMSLGATIGLLRRLGQDYAATTRLAEAHAAGDERGSRDAVVFYVFMSVATSIVVLSPAIALSPWLGDRFAADATVGALLPLYLVQGFWAVLPGAAVICLQATRRLGWLVRLESAMSLLAAVLPVALAVAGLGVSGVLWGQIGASLLAAGLGLIAYRRLAAADSLLPTWWSLARGIVRPEIALWPQIRYGLSIAVDKNLVSLYNVAPLLILGALAPESEVGILRVAMSYMAIPAVLLGPVSRLLMVDLPRLRASSPERVRPVFVRVTVLGCLASTAIAGMFVLVASWVVPLIYGETYTKSAGVALALALDAATLGLGLAAGPIFRTFNRTDLPILSSVAILLVGVPGAYLAVQAFGALGAALAYAGMLVASRLVSYVQCLRIMPR